MTNLILALTALAFFTQCSTPLTDTWVNPTFQNQDVIQKTFQTHPSNPYLKDATMAELFATLPYFKGTTYSERFQIVNTGKALKGSLHENYALGGGSFESPSVYFFADNGFGQEITITPLFEGDVSDYEIVIKESATGKLILSNQIYYTKFLEGSQAEFKTIRWVL